MGIFSLKSFIDYHLGRVRHKPLLPRIFSAGDIEIPEIFEVKYRSAEDGAEVATLEKVFELSREFCERVEESVVSICPDGKAVKVVSKREIIFLVNITPYSESIKFEIVWAAPPGC